MATNSEVEVLRARLKEVEGEMHDLQIENRTLKTEKGAALAHVEKAEAEAATLKKRWAKREVKWADTVAQNAALKEAAKLSATTLKTAKGLYNVLQVFLKDDLLSNILDRCDPNAKRQAKEASRAFEKEQGTNDPPTI